MQDMIETALVPNFGKHKGAILGLRRDDDSDAGHKWWNALTTSATVIKYLCGVVDHAQARIHELEERIATLESLATTDELTALLNRRGFMDAFAKEMDRTNRGHSEGGLLIMVDLDNFKTINDTYGHQAGDAALRLAAKTLSGDIRTMDSCARLGGDEFVLLLANTERSKALTRAQNMIRKMNTMTLVWHGTEIPVRASLGLKDYKAGDNTDAVFGEADERLYTVKRATKTKKKGCAIPVKEAI